MWCLEFTNLMELHVWEGVWAAESQLPALHWVLISCVLLNLQIVVTQIKIPPALIQVLSALGSGWQQWCLTSSSSIKKIQPDYNVGIFSFLHWAFFAWNFNLHVSSRRGWIFSGRWNCASPTHLSIIFSCSPPSLPCFIPLVVGFVRVLF